MHNEEKTLGLFLAHRAALVDYATAIVGCRARAEDVVQEAWLRFAPAAEGAGLAQPVGYLYRVVRNLAVDWARRLALENRQLDPTALPEAAADDRPSPEADALHRRELEVVRGALSELPERTRLALEMHRLGGHKLKDIATRLGISVTLAHALVHEGLVHCRRRLRGTRP